MFVNEVGIFCPLVRVWRVAKSIDSPIYALGKRSPNQNRLCTIRELADWQILWNLPISTKRVPEGLSNIAKNS